MKHMLKLIIPLVMVMIIFSQCDDNSVSPNGDQTKEEIKAQVTAAQKGKSNELNLLSPADEADKVSTNLEFTWTELSGIDEYDYQLSDDSEFKSTLQEKTVKGTSYKPDGLVHQKKYHWRVKAAGSDNWTETRTFTTGIEGEDEVTDEMTLVSPVHNADKVTTDLEFTWKKLSGASEYTYQLSDDSQFRSTLQEKTIEGTSYTPDGLVHQKKYHWRVKANTDGAEWSDVWAFTTGRAGEEGSSGNEGNGDGGSTSPVTLVSPVHDADKVTTDLEFTWKKLSGVSRYEYQLSDDSEFRSTLQEKTVDGTSYKPDGLAHQKRYHWRVKADVDGAEWSEVWTFITGTTGSNGNDGNGGNGGNGGSYAPGGEATPAVTLLSPADYAFDLSTDTEFEWDELSGINEYEYQISENSSFNSNVTEATVEGTTYQPDDLDHQKNYYWRVKAAGENSEWSEVWSFETEAKSQSTPSSPPSAGSFVGTQNSNFVVDGNVFRFAGTNAYYLPNYEKLNSGVVDRALDLFEDTGITVVRMWGFYDGYDCGYSKSDPNENVIQTSPGEYSEEALRDLDNVIAKGKERGIRFMMPFINYWDELGGICQYNTWAGASNPSTNMDFFLSNSQTQKWFKDYIHMLLNRTNTVTGVKYKDEPAIFAWQIMNEGRNSGKNANVIRDWYQEIARYIKSIDPNHMVSTGEEGFDEGTPSQYSVKEYSNTYTLRANEGTSYMANTSIPEIDFGNAHWYPTEYGFGSDLNGSFMKAQHAWLRDHKKIAESVGKPFIIGEFGYPGWGDKRVSAMYNDFYEYAESINLDGNLIWQITADGTKCWEFGGNICYPGGRADNGLYDKFKQHVINIIK